MSPRSANDTTMSPVADELCTAVATPTPARKARSGFAVACATARRKRSPKARSTPVLHHPRRPEQQRDASEEVEENGVAGHCRGMPRGVASEGVDPKGTVHPRTGSHNEKRVRFCGFLWVFYPFSIHSCAGSLWKRQMRRGPAITLR